ncbi:class I SAM-dependent methyltransferase [Roseomonas sp. E05]|uniref:class I SAM-dependent methyltransferase n=1 Tax=Roseomonas sp. E05 TaxID=3046310 RepID=UPI0024B9B6EC|nr:class I SAM-dependent methyltransferase [Roseomonas sp. E05]MDJ0386826.1 class I SAM-dependent methyltransferase [Roseomonas sp. E05]
MMDAMAEARPNPTLAQELTQRIYGEDIFAGFTPSLPPDMQGWNSRHAAFREVMEAVRPRIIVDVGVWKGASVNFLCETMGQLGIDGAVIAVDTFLGSPEHWNRERPDNIFASLRFTHGMPGLYWQFLSNMVHRKLQDRVVPLAQSSENAAVILKRLRIAPDMIHIDAAHEYEPVLRDTRLYWNLLAPGGVLIGDDYSWKGVAKAADEFAVEVGQPLAVNSPKWILRKPGQRKAA